MMLQHNIKKRFIVSIFTNISGFDNRPLAEGIRTIMPDRHVEIWPDIADDNAIHYAIIWQHPHHDLSRYQNLKAVFSIAAGTDHITTMPDMTFLLARNIPIVRMHNPDMAEDMAQYALYWVLHFTRNFHLFAHAQTKAQWLHANIESPEDYPIGIIGMGKMGTVIARKLIANNFRVSGMKKTKTTNDSTDNIKIYSSENWQEFLSSHKIFINLVPKTESTNHLLNHAMFYQMPKNSILINIARGNSVDSHALMQALDDDQLAHAVLDVFETEPLPVDSPLWQHPKISLTPHIAGRDHLASSAKIIAENIKNMEQNKTAFPIYNHEKGY